MTGFTDYSAQNSLNYIVGKTAMPTLPTVYVALFTAVGTDAGTGFTEVTGGSYARVATSGATWSAASGSAPSSITNASAITFPAATADWTNAGANPIIATGLYDALTSGNLLAWDYLGNFSWLPTTVSLASPGILTVKAHGYSATDPVIFSTEYGGTAPTFSASTFTGVLKVVSPATDSFSVTNSAVAVNTSSTGSGMVRKIVQQLIPSGIQASYAASQLTVTLA
ncbi:MAG: hypothetical protein JWP25_4688 [Bradyrhizobium sp.]|nr:hypothetical protein [Bradyrhizobium sp.]